MTGFKHEPRLHGWDDEKVYFSGDEGGDHGIPD